MNKCLAELIHTFAERHLGECADLPGATSLCTELSNEIAPAVLVQDMDPVQLVALHDAVRDALIVKGVGRTDPSAICGDLELPAGIRRSVDAAIADLASAVDKAASTAPDRGCTCQWNRNTAQITRFDDDCQQHRIPDGAEK